MEKQNERLKKLFEEGFKEYLREGGEKNLTQAYELGRKSLQEGFSKLDIIALYHEVLSDYDELDLSPDQQEHLKTASAYLIECLAPFELRLRSYRDLIKDLNEEIETRREVEDELKRSRDYFQALIENAQDIIAVVDPQAVFRYCSPAIERILGYDQEDLVGREAFQYMHPEDLENTKRLFDRVRDNPGHTVPAEFRFRHKNGRWVYLESIAKNVQDNIHGTVIIVNARDVTGRKKAMRKLRESEAQLSEAQQIAKVGSWEWQPGADSSLNWSKEMCRIYGLEMQNFDHRFETFLNHIHPDDRERVEKIVEEAMVDRESFSFENRIIRTDGKERTLLCRGQVITDHGDEIVKMIGTGQDITEQKKREKKLRRYSERLRKLSARIERTREEERTKIAREIHDELGQMLTVLKMDVSMLSTRMEDQIPSGSLDFFNEKTENIRERISVIIKSIQRITTELRPEVLDTMGLKDAIEWKADEFENRTGININFKTNIGRTGFLDNEQAITLFRIFQETLTNVIRHAMASKVEIELTKDENSLILLVRDNGVGIKPGDLEEPSSLGIIGIRERTQFLGGEVDIKGEEGKGTTITLRIPINADGTIH